MFKEFCLDIKVILFEFEVAALVIFGIKIECKFMGVLNGFYLVFVVYFV